MMGEDADVDAGEDEDADADAGGCVDADEDDDAVDEAGGAMMRMTLNAGGLEAVIFSWLPARGRHLFKASVLQGRAWAASARPR